MEFEIAGPVELVRAARKAAQDGDFGAAIAILAMADDAIAARPNFAPAFKEFVGKLRAEWEAARSK